MYSGANQFTSVDKVFSSKFPEGYSDQVPNEGQKSRDKSNKDGYDRLYINNVNKDNSTPQIFRCL